MLWLLFSFGAVYVCLLLLNANSAMERAWRDRIGQDETQSDGTGHNGTGRNMIGHDTTQK